MRQTETLGPIDSLQADPRQARRDFLRSTAAATLLGAMGSAFTQPALAQSSSAAQGSKRPRKILLRSSWQVVNIGDIAHTPGVLTLLEKYHPDAEVRLWASNDLSPEVIEMEHHRFPKLKIIKGTIGSDGKASNAELGEALKWCDFLLHGSGPSLVAQKDVSAFLKFIRKPFGVYGITYGGGNPETIKVLSQAKFAFFRDSVSLGKAKAEKVASPVVDFAPDGAFACDLRNDAAAEKWLAEHDLQPGKFCCCLTRARYTPYWLVRPNTKLDETKQARNKAMFEQDHAPVRKAIIDVVEKTDLKVLLCPEDATQMQVGREWLLDKLPASVRKRVVWRDKFWLTDEALSTYVRSAGLFGLEMHSPIMAVGNGIPAIVGRFEEQTSKGFMWKDIGLGKWLFDFDQAADRDRYAAAVVEMLTQREASAELVKQAQKFVQDRQAATMAAIG